MIIAIFAACLLIWGAFILHSCEILNEVNGHSEVILKEEKAKDAKPDNYSRTKNVPSDKPRVHLIE